MQRDNWGQKSASERTSKQKQPTCEQPQEDREVEGEEEVQAQTEEESK